MNIQAVDQGLKRKAVWGARVRLLGAVVLTAATISCGEVVRQGSGNSFLMILALEGASGAEPSEFGSVVSSDVVTIVDDNSTIFADPGRVVFRLGTKDPGSIESPTIPTQNMFITLDRYRVRYIRADGRNTPGVDVPYGFDGGVTVTIDASDTPAGFELVRIQAKQEAPLAALARNPIAISTIAEVTFYGRDQTGREVTVVGRISVNFANWGDPAS